MTTTTSVTDVQRDYALSRIEIDCFGASRDEYDALFELVADLAHKQGFDVSCWGSWRVKK